MKVFIVFTFVCFNLFAQVESEDFHGKYVEAYYNNETMKSLYIYDSVNGNIVDTLKSEDSKNAWYKLTIIESDYGWLKIKNLQSSSSSITDSDTYWVKNIDVSITAENYDHNLGIYLYDEPFESSNRIHRLDNLQEVNVVEISDLWTKVSLNVGKKKVSGWLSYNNQCASPGTECLNHN